MSRTLSSSWIIAFYRPVLFVDYSAVILMKLSSFLLHILDSIPQFLLENVVAFDNYVSLFSKIFIFHLFHFD